MSIELTFDEKFSNAYTKLYNIFKNIGIRKFGSVVVAEDLAQNAFALAYPLITKDSSEARIRTYVTSVFRHSLSRQASKLYKEKKHIVYLDGMLSEEEEQSSVYDSAIMEDSNAITPFTNIEVESLFNDLINKITNPVAKEILKNIIDTSKLPGESTNGSGRTLLMAIEKHIGLQKRTIETWYVPKYIRPYLREYYNL